MTGPRRVTLRFLADPSHVNFVALNEEGRPKPVPVWTPETETDHALHQYAVRLIELGKLMDSEMEARLALLEQAGA